MLTSARAAVAVTQRDLKPALENAKSSDIQNIADRNIKNNLKLDAIDK